MSEEAVTAALLNLEDKLRQEGGLGFYIVVIKARGKSVSHKAARKDFDGFNFYAHLLSTLTEDVKADLAPYLSVKLQDDQSGRTFGPP